MSTELEYIRERLDKAIQRDREVLKNEVEAIANRKSLCSHHLSHVISALQTLRDSLVRREALDELPKPDPAQN